MSETNWYVVHTYSGYENKVKANIDKTIENRHLEDQILEVRVPLEEVTEAEGWTLLAHTFDLHHQEDMMVGNVMTEYEEKFSSMGNPICKLIARCEK